MTHKIDPLVLSALVRSADAGALAYVARVLRSTGGDCSEAARLLGVGRTTVYRWRKVHPGLAATTAGARLGP